MGVHDDRELNRPIQQYIIDSEVDPFPLMRWVSPVGNMIATLMSDGSYIAGSIGLADLNTSAKPTINVKDPAYGAVGDLVADDTAAIQAAIDAAISPGDPATTVRNGLATVYFPPGNYRITSPLRVQSVLDFHMQGSGNSSVICPSVAGMECALDLNGIAYSKIEGLRFQSSGPGSVTRAVWLRWNGMARSTAFVHFSDLTVRNLLWTRAAFELGDVAAPSVQVDTTTWINCLAAGGFVVASGDVTNYQAAFHVGTGTSANNLIHSFFGCIAANARYGLYNSNSQALWVGGQIQGNDYDVYASGLGYTAVKGVRSEGSGRLLETAGPASYGSIISLEDIVWNSNALNADNYFVGNYVGGSLRLSNVLVPYRADKTPRIRISSIGQLGLILEGVMTSEPLSTFIVENGSGSVTTSVVNYAQLDASNVPSSYQNAISGINGVLFSADGTLAAPVRDLVGTGSPEGVVAANIGSVFRRTDGGAGTTLYIKESGVGNTGWVAK